MSAVTIRKVANRLERMVRAGGDGIKARKALTDAEKNLATIEESCLRELDLQLGPIIAFLDQAPEVRPSPESLAALIYHADRALTACGALNIRRLNRPRRKRRGFGGHGVDVLSLMFKAGGDGGSGASACTLRPAFARGTGVSRVTKPLRRACCAHRAASPTPAPRPAGARRTSRRAARTGCQVPAPRTGSGRAAG